MALSVERARAWLPPVAVAALAAFVAWAFAATTLATTRRMGLPLDESYAVLVHAKQLGLRGTFGIWIAFGLCAALYAAAGLGVYLSVRRVGDDPFSAVAAAAMSLAIAPFASGMLATVETAATVVLVVASVLLVVRQPATGRPSWLLVATLVVTSLVRADAMLLVTAIVGVAIGERLARRAWRELVWWLVPLAAAPVWLVRGFEPGYARAALDRLATAGVWPLLVLALVVVGAVRVGVWARRDKRVLAGVTLFAAPIVMVQSAAVFPLLGILVGGALQPFVVRRAWQAGALVLAGVFAYGARPALVTSMRTYAQGVKELDAGAFAIGTYLRDRLPDAYVVADAARVVAYHARGPVTAWPGSDGPGERFEHLESLPPERRPTHLAYRPRDTGTLELAGDVAKSMPGMRLVAASFDHVGTAERPLNDHTGWDLVDRVDVAHVVSERAHAWRGATGSLVERSRAGALYIDGGRTVDASEQFVVRVDPTKPSRVVLRTGGQRAYPGHPSITRPIQLTLYAGTKKLGSLTIAPPRGAFAEVTFNLPPYVTQTGTLVLRTEGTGPYRVFHWFVLQPTGTRRT